MRILVSIHDLPVWSIPPAEVDRIRRALPDDDVVDVRGTDDRARELPEADVLYATRLTAEEFARASRLRWVHSSAAGVGSLLSPALVESEVVVTNSRGVHSTTIAEHAIALMLALRRDLHVAVRRQLAREWAQQELYDRASATLAGAPLGTMLVIGFGTIGARVAAMAAALGMTVNVVRRRVSDPPAGVTRVFSSGQLSEALPSADVIVLATAHTAETRLLIGAPEFDCMKPSALVINVARGELVDEAALIRALDSGRIAGAGLDAFNREPLPAESPLWALPNVLLSPHTATFDGDYWRPIVDLFLSNVMKVKRGETPMNLVDKRAGY
jgi:phosphoglycerate dehydrogenase-like enzyme